MKKIFVYWCFSFLLMAQVCAQTFSVATYNIRLYNAGDSIAGNGWAQRSPYLTQLIKFHEFDIFGTQEGMINQLEDMKRALPGYQYIGVGRNDGKQGGEHAAIFYDTSKFEVLEHGDFWLSTVTDRPNVGWDAALPRICTWGKFKHKESGFVFMYYNLHMDHIGVVARAESSKLIMRKVQEHPEKLPAILSGDFNIDQYNESYQLIDQSGLLSDAYRTADLRYMTKNTFNDFKAESLGMERRIDHIFLTDHFHVKKYGVLTDSYRTESTDADGKVVGVSRVPSDHFPVMIVVEIKK